LLVDLRAHALSHPLLLLLLIVAGLAVFRRLRNSSATAAPAPPRPVVTTIAACLAYLAAAIGYAAVPAYIDHVEPSVAAVSWLAIAQTQPLYPPPGSALMYGLPYGPALFLANGTALRAFGPTILTSKLAGVLAALASIVVLALAVRRIASARDAGVAHTPVQPWMLSVRTAAVGYLAFGAASFWVRAEPLMLLCSSVALLSATMTATSAVLLFGVALGCGVNLKVSAVLYLLPAGALLRERHGTRAVMVAAAVAVIVAILPFAALTSLSLDGYLAWLRSAANQGIRLSALPLSIEWAVLLAVALYLPAAHLSRATAAPASEAAPMRFRAMTTVAILASLPLALKHGTGAYHFLPFVPAVAFAAGLHTRPRASLIPDALAVCFASVAALHAMQWIPALTSLPAREIVAELNDAARRHDSPKAVGYSANYRLSFFRPVLVFAGEPYALDGASVMDWHWSRRDFPPPALDAMRACAVRTWIVPAGAAAFALPNAYPIDGDAFPDELRAIFRDRYVLKESGKWFDVWECRSR